MKNAKVVFDGFHKIVEFESEVKGRTVKRESLVAKSAVAGIIIDENNRIGLVSQYRPVIQRHTKELPAGVLDKEGLSALDTLVEELMEECEISKEEILSIKENPIEPYFMMAGNTDAIISFCEIRVKAQENKKVNDADVDEVEWVTLEEMKEYISNGAICDSKTRMVYYYLLSQQ
jgi:ADP-ribose pyrophosphatase